MSISNLAHPRTPWLTAWSFLRDIAPGLALTVALATLAVALRQLPGVGLLSPLIVAFLLGVAWRNAIGTPTRLKPGLVFSLRRILRLAIVLLGLQLTIGQVLSVGGIGLIIVAIVLAATFGFTVWFGRRLGIDRKLTELIAAGTAICGASAILATNTVTQATEEDAAYAVACVTIFGSLAMMLYPLLPALLHMDAPTYGLWAGASLHEVAQVVGAGFQHGQDAGDLAVIVKLSRVLLLAPLVLWLGYAARTRIHAVAGQRAALPPVPWFVFGFLGMALINSGGAVPALAKASLVTATPVLLSIALAAMGLETDLRKLRAKGWRPLALGAVASLFIALGSLALIEVTHGS